jgi:lysophospholipase L1-like esterase
MKFGTVTRALAFVAAASLAACNGGGSNPVPTGPVQNPTGNLLGNIVGVGDSLTAGEQSGGFFGGAPGSVANPLATGLPVAALGVPPTQVSGWFSQFFMAAKGMPYGVMANPASSVLPLVGPPGLGNQIVPANPALTGGIPFGQLPNRSGCDSFNASAWTKSSVSSIRLNPTALPNDTAVPGITLHEALSLYQPPTASCVLPPGSPTQFVLLSQALSESQYFYPVLGSFPNAGAPGFSELGAANSLHPTLATVWLGANDVLHYTFTGGQFVGIDNTVPQVQADMTQIITTLQHGGANVVVANIPDVIQAPFFASVAAPPAPAACQVATYVTCLLSLIPALAPNAGAIDAAIAAKYNLAPNGYLTIGGVISLAKQLGGGVPLANVSLDPAGPGSGLGNEYVTPAFATQIQTLNNTINTGIANAAQATKAPMVDIHTIFAGIASGNLANPYFQLAASINPGVCCTLAFGGGLESFDGLHPSNTGYALIALAFAQTINTAYGTTIPFSPADVHAAYVGSGNPAAPGIPFHDPYAP